MITRFAGELLLALFALSHLPYQSSLWAESKNFLLNLTSANDSLITSNRQDTDITSSIPVNQCITISTNRNCTTRESPTPKANMSPRITTYNKTDVADGDIGGDDVDSWTKLTSGANEVEIVESGNKAWRPESLHSMFSMRSSEESSKSDNDNFRRRNVDGVKVKVLSRKRFVRKRKYGKNRNDRPWYLNTKSVDDTLKEAFAEPLFSQPKTTIKPTKIQNGTFGSVAVVHKNTSAQEVKITQSRDPLKPNGTADKVKSFRSRPLAPTVRSLISITNSRNDDTILRPNLSKPLANNLVTFLPSEPTSFITHKAQNANTQPKKQPKIAIVCSNWKLWNEYEFQVLDNQSVFANVTKKLYDWSEYVLINDSVWVCENNQTNNWPPKLLPRNKILPTLTFAGMLLSIISLVFVLITYSLFTELRTPPGINLMNLSVSILLSQLLWLAGSEETDNHLVCTAIAILLHYFFLVSFVWTSIIAFDTWRAFTAKGPCPHADSKRKKFKHSKRYIAFGWLSAMVYVTACVALDQTDSILVRYGSRDVCWIADDGAKFYFYGIPVGLMIIFNISFFSMTVKTIKNTRHQARLVADQSERSRQFGVYVRIASLMGFTWVFGLIAAPFGWLSEILVYAFVVLNSLQGVYIAIAFLLNKRTRKLYRDLMRGKGHPTKGKLVKQKNDTNAGPVSTRAKENMYPNYLPAAV